MTGPDIQALNVPGATLTYEIREAQAETTEPVLLMIGAPMDASGFTALAAQILDRTVVTYDPRGVARGPRADGATGRVQAGQSNVADVSPAGRRRERRTRSCVELRFPRTTKTSGRIGAGQVSEASTAP
jgi:hypothetical protein